MTSSVLFVMRRLTQEGISFATSASTISKQLVSANQFCLQDILTGYYMTDLLHVKTKLVLDAMVAKEKY